jgi:hypothetical protein
MMLYLPSWFSSPIPSTMYFIDRRKLVAALQPHCNIMLQPLHYQVAASSFTTLFSSNFPTKNSNFLLMNTSFSLLPLFNFALEGIYAAP